MSEVKLYLGDCLEVMRSIPDKSVDAVITDPPYELGFMGKAWDASGIAYSVEMWREVLRVLKPGGHLLSFGGTRTYHRMACAIEDAGFEIRDQIQWLYGSGFPKSYNISKGIDKMMGTEREMLGNYKTPDGRDYTLEKSCQKGYAKTELSMGKNIGVERRHITAPATPEAQQWDGWGSALKPANEPICLARKPLSEKTIVENVLKWGTGGINIDDCRIELNGEIVPINKLEEWSGFGQKTRPDYVAEQNNKGRFPANLILDEEAGRMLDEQSGENKSNLNIRQYSKSDLCGDGGWNSNGNGIRTFGDSGGASRFFYCAKASRSERNVGLEGMEEKEKSTLQFPATEFTDYDGQIHKPSGNDRYIPRQNHHPTVKPISLMRYLCKLITPPNGMVLDPFMGSGTTGISCVLESFDFIGIEQDVEYLEIAEKRIKDAQQQMRLPI